MPKKADIYKIDEQKLRSEVLDLAEFTKKLKAELALGNYEEIEVGLRN